MSERKTPILAASLLLMALAFGSVYGQGTAKTKEWTADPAAVKKLGAAVDAEGYTIQIPKSFERLEVSSGVARMKSSGWGGPRRKDQTRPSIAFNVITFEPAVWEKMKEMPLEQLLERLTRTLKSNQQNWKQDQPERALIGGIEFVRIHWSGFGTQFNHKMRGFTYIGKDGDYLLQLTSQDLVPDGEKELPIAEAAILSLKKNGVATPPAAVQAKPVLQTWTADPEAVKLLDKDYEVLGFTLKLPKGYKPETPPGNRPGQKLAGWESSSRNNGAGRHSIRMDLRTVPANERKMVDGLALEDMANQWMKVGIKDERNMQNWKQEPAEHGMINEIEFVRIRWSAVDPSTKREMDGMVYLGRFQDQVLLFHTKDYATESQKSFPLAEAAYLTFKVK